MNWESWLLDQGDKAFDLYWDHFAELCQETSASRTDS